MLAGAGGYLAERVADLDDVRDRAVAAVLGRPMPGVPHPGFPYVLVADDLAPADTVGLDPATVLALVTERGSPTSHTAILARSLGLPAVVGLPGAAGLADGTVVRVDGSAGTVEVGADPTAVGGAAGELPDYAGPGRTADGHAVQLLLNIGSAADLATGGGGPAAALRDAGIAPRRASGCSGPSSCSSTGTTCRLRTSSRPRTRRRSGRPAGGRSCCGRWTRAPTSRCRSSACGRSPTRPWAYGGCGWRGCGRRC
jgi:phosphohistidine swiveling domain-containing protein